MKYLYIHKKTGRILLDSSKATDDYTQANGREVRRDEYPELFARIGTLYGSKNKFVFNLPTIKVG